MGLQESFPSGIPKNFRQLQLHDLIREAPVRFGSVTVRGWNGSSGSGFRFLCKKGFSLFQYSLTGKDDSGSGFGSWETVPAVPVPLSVSGKTVPTVPVPSSGSVAEPPCLMVFELKCNDFRQAQSTRTAKFDPTSVPTSGPTKTPTRAPTRVPTRVPTNVHFPVLALQGLPTKVPTKRPTRVSTEVPTKISTKAVSFHMSCFHMFCSLPMIAKRMVNRWEEEQVVVGAARGLLQGRPMAWGVGEELIKSWPTKLLWSNSVYKIMPWRFRFGFSPTKSACNIRLARSWPRVGHGLPTFATSISVLNCRGLSCRGGGKRENTTTVGPLFSRSVARPRGHRAKQAMVYTIFLGEKTREKGIHHRSGKKGIHHGASDPEKEKKEGLHGGGVYFLLSWEVWQHPEIGSLLWHWLKSLASVSCYRATQRLHRCKSRFALSGAFRWSPPFWNLRQLLSGLQKGPAERGHVKKRQKSSKSVKNLFDNFHAGQKTSKIVKKCRKVFRHFSTIFAQGQKCQKSSKSVEKFFDTFWQFSRGTIFPAPFGGLRIHSESQETRRGPEIHG